MVPGPAQLKASLLHPRKGMNVSSRRCNLRINAKQERGNSPERAEHSPMEGVFAPPQGREEYHNVNEFRRLHLRLLL